MTYNAQTEFTHAEFAAGVDSESMVLIKQFHAAHNGIMTAEGNINLARIAFDREVEVGTRVPELYDGDKVHNLFIAYNKRYRELLAAHYLKDNIRREMRRFERKISRIALHLDGEPKRKVEIILGRMLDLILIKNRP